jgi:lipoate-protein ligase B
MEHRMQAKRPGTWRVFEPGCIDYGEAMRLQHRLVEARKSRVLATDVLILLEHPPVFTLGRRGGRENLIVASEVLANAGIQVIQTERGGNITYHGPGQLVAYLILDLEAAKMGVKAFVHCLEDVMIRTAADWGVAAERNPANRGIWVGNSKMGSIGIAIRRGITYHGLAFNVDVSLEPFGWINPCGLADVGITSLQAVSGRPLNMPSVGRAFKGHVQSVFGTELLPIERDEVEKILLTDA